MPGTPSPVTISTRRRRIADRAVAARSRANSWHEEPGALIGHARIRGGPRRATAPAYPTSGECPGFTTGRGRLNHALGPFRFSRTLRSTDIQSIAARFLLVNAVFRGSRLRNYPRIGGTPLA